MTKRFNKYVSIIFSLIFLGGFMIFPGMNALADGITVNKIKFETVDSSFPNQIADRVNDLKEQRGFIVFDGNNFSVPQDNYYVLICSGTRNTGGYATTAQAVEDNEGKTIITVDEKAPKPDEIVNMMVTYPLVLVKLPHSGIAPNFVVRNTKGEEIKPFIFNGSGATGIKLSDDVNYEVVKGDKYPAEVISKLNIVKQKRQFYVYANLISKTGKFEYYVLITSGEKPTGGYSVDPVSVKNADGKIVITVNESSPSKDDMVNQMVTYPNTLLRIIDASGPDFIVQNTNNEKFDQIMFKQPVVKSGNTSSQVKDNSLGAVVSGKGTFIKKAGNTIFINVNNKVVKFTLSDNIKKSKRITSLKKNAKVSFKYTKSKTGVGTLTDIK